MPACAKPYAIAIEPSAVTIHDNSEIAPTFAMFVGSMMMPEPIMLTVTMNVSCTTFIFFCGISHRTPSFSCRASTQSLVAQCGSLSNDVRVEPDSPSSRS